MIKKSYSELSLPLYLYLTNPVFLVEHNLGLAEQKIWNAMLLFAHDSLLTEEYHKISFATLMTISGTKKQTDIPKNLRKIKKRRSQGQWEIRCYFEDIKISQNAVSYKYPKHIRHLGFHRHIYEIKKKLLAVSFGSKYTYLLYEFCLYWHFFGYLTIVSVSALKCYLNVTSAKYNNVKSFIDTVLIKSIHDINELTSLTVTFKPIKEAGQIVALGVVVKNSDALVITNEELTRLVLLNLAFFRTFILFKEVLKESTFSIDTHIAPIEKEFIMKLISEVKQ